MPHWMEAVVNDVPEKEQHELKNLLRSVTTFDFSPCIIFLHPHVAACVFRRFHKQALYRRLIEVQSSLGQTCFN